MSATEPGPGEKVCPYCAEVIKAAAIRCRYCHSDLAPAHRSGTPAPAEDRSAAPVPATDAGAGERIDPARSAEEADPDPDQHDHDQEALEAAARPRRRLDPVAVGLGVLCLALAAALWALVSTGPGELAKADNGQVTAPAYRSAAMGAAATNASAILGYSYRTLAEDQKAARAVTTGKARKGYDDAMAKAGPKATTAKLTLKAEVLSTSLVSLTEHRAKVLLFYNAVTSAEGSRQQQLNLNRVLMTMTRQDGDWIVSEMEAF